MATTKVQLPSGEAVRVQHKEGASEQDILQYAFEQYVINDASNTAIGRGIAQGIDNLQKAYGSSVEGIGSFLDSESLKQIGADIVTQQEADIAARQFRVQRDIPQDVGTFTEGMRYVETLAGESAPQMATTLAGAAAGAAAGSVVPVVGTAVGAFVGGFLANVPYFYGSNRERQKEAIERGIKTEVDEGAAALAAIPQSALDAIIGALGAKFLATPAMKAGGGIFTRAAKGSAVGSVTEAPTEIGQAVLERYQAGLPLTDNEAMIEYAQAGVGGAVLGGLLGGGGAVMSRTPAETQQQREEVIGNKKPFSVQYERTTKDGTTSNVSEVIYADSLEDAQAQANELLSKDNAVLNQTLTVTSAPTPMDAAPTPEPEVAPIEEPTPVSFPRILDQIEAERVQAEEAAPTPTPAPAPTAEPVTEFEFTKSEGKPNPRYIGGALVEYANDFSRAVRISPKAKVFKSVRARLKEQYNLTDSQLDDLRKKANQKLLEQKRAGQPLSLDMTTELPSPAPVPTPTPAPTPAPTRLPTAPPTEQPLIQEGMDQDETILYSQRTEPTVGARRVIQELRDVALPIFNKVKNQEVVTAEESRELASVADTYKPATKRSVPEPETTERMKAAHGERKAKGVLKSDLVGVIPSRVEEGQEVAGRLDIPSYEGPLKVWTATLHEPASPNPREFGAGDVIGYDSVMYLTDVTFGIGSEKRGVVQTLAITKGSGKGTIATMRGKYKKVSPEEAKRLADQFNDDPAWTQVGMDPERRNYFYNRDESSPDFMREVIASDEVIQVGPVVLAKNVQYGPTPKNEFVSRLAYEIEGEPTVGAAQKKKKLTLEDLIKLAEQSPEATIPSTTNMPYDLLGSPFVAEFEGKEGGKIDKFNLDNVHYKLSGPAKNRIQAAIDSGAVTAAKNRLVEETRKMLGEEGVSQGMGWYSRMRKRLREIHGDQSRLFTHLLGATSAQTPVDDNFVQAVDAINQYKEGLFDRHIKSYIELRSLLSQGKLAETLVDRGIIESSEGLTQAKLAEAWINHYDILPKKRNGAKFNANSNAVLKALSGYFIDGKVDNPKTPQFSMNLNGESLEATIDVWAARTLRRILWGDKEQRWRLLPSVETGVNPEDFAFGQLVFREAAKDLRMNPDDLQAVVWFGEKDLWGKNAWTNLTGAKKSSFDEAAEAFYPAGQNPRSFEEGKNIVDFLKAEAKYEYDVATDAEYQNLDKKSKEYKNQTKNRRSHLKEYEEARTKKGVAEYIEQRGQEDTGAGIEGGRIGRPEERSGLDTGRGVQDGPEVGAAQQPTPGQNAQLGDAVTSAETLAEKIGAKVQARNDISRDAQYNYETRTIEYNPELLARRGPEGAKAAMREEVIHASMHKVLMDRAKGKTPRKAFEDFFNSVGKSMTPEQRSMMQEVYGSELDDLGNGAEYTRFLVQSALDGRTTEETMTTGPAFSKVQALIKSVQNYAARVFGKDLEQNREAAFVIADTIKLLRSFNPEARPANQKIVSDALAMVSGLDALSSENISDPSIGTYEERTRKQKLSRIKRSVTRVIQPASEFFNSINPRITQELRKYLTGIESDQADAAKMVQDFQKGITGIRNKEDRDKLARLLSYSPDQQSITEGEHQDNIRQRDELLLKYDLYNKYKLQVRPLLDQLYQKAVDAGLDVNYLQEYFPRKIKDFDGLMNLFGKDVQDDFLSYIEQENELRRSRGEKMIIPSDYATEFQIYMDQKKFVQPSKLPSFIKERKTNMISKEAQPFYYEPEVALSAYLNNMIDAIATQNLVGNATRTKQKPVVVDGQTIMALNLQDPTGSLNRVVGELVANGEITKGQMQNLEYGLVQFLNPKNASEGDLFKLSRTFGYGTLLVEVTSTLSNMYDMAFTMLDNNILPSLGAMVGRKDIKMRDLGFDPDRLSAEYPMGGKGKTKFFNDLVKMGLTATGFRRMDQLMKETNLTANYRRFQRLAKLAPNSKKHQKFRKEVEFLVGPDVDNVINDLKLNKPDSPFVRELLTNKILETQPLNRLELPLLANDNANGRALYLMKSFMVKQMGLIWRRQIAVMTNRDLPFKQRSAAAGDAVKLLLLFMLVGLPVDFFKDLLAGRDVYPDDYVTNALLRVAGMSKYTIYQAKKEGIGGAARSYFMPVGIDQTLNMATDIGNILMDPSSIPDAKAVSYLPFSDLWYYRYGPGVAKQERQRTRKRKEGVRPGEFELLQALGL